MVSIAIMVIKFSLLYYGTMRELTKIVLIHDKVVLPYPDGEGFKNLMRNVLENIDARLHIILQLYDVNYLKSIKESKNVDELLSFLKNIHKIFGYVEVYFKVIGEVEVYALYPSNVVIIDINDKRRGILYTYVYEVNFAKINKYLIKDLRNEINLHLEFIFNKNAILLTDLIELSIEIINRILEKVDKSEKP